MLKLLLGGGLSAALLGACQPAAETRLPPAATGPPAAPAVVAAQAAAPAPADKPSTPAAELPVVFVAPIMGTDSFPPPGPPPLLNDFLRQHKLSPRWTLPYDANRNEALNGFFGPDHYRIEFAFLEARADSLQPNVFRVRGKDRFKKTILPFEGTIVFDELQNQPLLSAARKRKLSDPANGQIFHGYPDSYTLTGRFVLREDSTRAKSGEFRGRIVIDLRVDKGGFIEEYAPDELSASRGAGVLFSGTWTSYKTGVRKPLTIFSSPFTYGESVLKNFMIGDRAAEFNPKYARLGWTNYWANEEWWADSQVVTPLL